MRRKIAAQFLVSNVATLVNFVLTIILARILTPSDVGIFSMSAVLIGVAHVFRDFGVTAYLKQEKELSNKTLSGAIGLLFLCSVVASLVMFFSASYWVAFYREPAVEPVVKVLAVGFLLIPFGAIPQALLMREMDVVRSAWVTAISTLIYFAVSVGLALAGAKHMTMAWANLINIMVSGFAYNYVLRNSLKWKFSFYGWGKIFGFGSGNLLAALMKTADAAVPDVLLGRLSNAFNVGLFSRANSTVNIVGMVVHPTIYFFAVPYMAKTHHARGNLSEEYLRSASIVNCLMLPALAWVAIASQEIVTVLYGSQWLGAVSVIPWLSLMCGAGTIFLMAGYAVTGIGKPHAVIAPLAIALLAKFVFVVLFYDGTMIRFSMALACGQIAAMPFFVWSIVHYLDVNALVWLKSTIKPAFIWIPVWGAYYLFHVNIMADWSYLLKLPIGAFAYVGAIFLGYLLVDIPIRDELRRIGSEIKIRLGG